MGFFNRKKRIQMNKYLHLALLKIYSGFEHKVYDALFNIPEIIECHPLLGDWDFFIKIASTDSLDLNIEEKIKSIPQSCHIDARDPLCDSAPIVTFGHESLSVLPHCLR